MFMPTNSSTESDSADATRFAAVAATHADHADATRIVCSSAADSDATRIARDVPDLQTEGARIRVHAVPTQQASAAEHEVVERYRIGDKIGDRYEVLAIHRGTMGVVYGTYDHEEKLPRALKTLQQRHAGDSKMRELFAEEALTWVRLEKHPFIVRAYLVENFDTQPYVITEYILGQENMGGDLRAWLGHPKLTLSVAVEMALQIAQGMQYAVRKVPGLLHRDLKPANILVNGEARAMVTDFGLVHAEDAGAGTPAYMAPEQWRAEKLDARTDIYAYGCVLYEMFTGHRMYSANSEHEWEAAHLTQVPLSPIALNPNLPPPISVFIEHCLAKPRIHRPHDWDEVVLECARWFYTVTGLPVVFDFSADSLSAQEQFNAGYSFGILNKLEDALSAYDRALALDPNHVLAWYNKGVSLSELKCHDEALGAYDHALAIDPNDIESWMGRDTALNSLSRYEEALAANDRATTLDPNNLVAWYNKAVTLNELIRYDEAIAASDRAIAIDANCVNAWVVKGAALNKLKRYEEAIPACDHALALDASDVIAWYNKAVALNELKLYEAAISAYDRTLALNSNIVVASKNRKLAIEELQRIGEELAAKDSMPAPDMNHATEWFSKGRTLYSCECYEEALAAFDKALVLDPDSVTVWNHKGATLGKLKRREEALAAYEQTLVLDANYVAAWINIGNTLYSLTRDAEAISAYDRALALDPNNRDASKNRALALKELKRPAEAISSRDQERVLPVSDAKACQPKNAVLRKLWPLEQKATASRPKSFWAKLWGK